MSRAEVDDLVGSRVLEAHSGGEQSTLRAEGDQDLARRRRRKGKHSAQEEVCECGASVVGNGDGTEICTCPEHVQVSSLRSLPPHKSKSRPSRHARQAPNHESSASDDPPASFSTRTIPAVSPRRPTQHSRSQSAAPQSQHLPCSTFAPSHPAVQIHHARSGYLSVVGESEIEAFERSQRVKKKGRSKSADLGGRECRRTGGEGGKEELKLEPPTGWGWVRIEDEGIATAGLSPPLEGQAHASRPRLDRSPPRVPTDRAPETPSPYTLLLLSQRARLAEKLRDLKLAKMEQERGRPFLEETTEAEEEQRERVVVRRRVERVGQGWWRG